MERESFGFPWLSVSLKGALARVKWAWLAWSGDGSLLQRACLRMGPIGQR